MLLVYIAEAAVRPPPYIFLCSLALPIIYIMMTLLLFWFSYIWALPLSKRGLPLHLLLPLSQFILFCGSNCTSLLDDIHWLHLWLKSWLKCLFLCQILTWYVMDIFVKILLMLAPPFLNDISLMKYHEDFLLDFSYNCCILKEIQHDTYTFSHIVFLKMTC